MFLGFASHVLKDTSLPKTFHVIPVLDKTVSDGIIQTVMMFVLHGIISNVKIQILTLGFIHRAFFVVGRDGCRNHELRLYIRLLFVSVVFGQSFFCFFLLVSFLFMSCDVRESDAK